MNRILLALGTIFLFMGVFSFIGAVQAEADRIGECGFEMTRSFACRIGSYYDTWALVFGGLGMILFLLAWRSGKKSRGEA